MQETYHQKMTPKRPFEYTKEMNRDLKAIGFFFCYFWDSVTIFVKELKTEEHPLFFYGSMTSE